MSSEAKLGNDPNGPHAIKGKVAIGPCAHVDAGMVALLSDAMKVLYGSVGAARGLPATTDPEKAAMREVVIATACLAATEAEALVTLTSLDLIGPARIHARALGDDARRVNIFYRRPDIASKVYASLDATRKQLAQKVEAGHEFRELADQFFADITGETMEQIERKLQADFGADDSLDHIMTPYERARWSKWAHGDVTAMAEAVTRLRAAGDDLRTAINVEDDATLVLHRAVGFVLTVVIVFIALGVDAQKDFNALLKRSGEYREKFKLQLEETKKRVREFVAKTEPNEPQSS